MSYPPDPQENKKGNIYQTRQEKLTTALKIEKLDALILNPGPSLIYFTGLHFHLSERPVVVILTTDNPPSIILPELETQKMEALSFSVQVFPYGENPLTWQSVFSKALNSAFEDSASETPTIGVEPRRLRYLELSLIQKAAPSAQIIPDNTTIPSLRMYKDEQEISAMRKAVDIAQNALSNTLPSIKIGVSERQIANELTLQLLKAGSDPQFPFSPIVSGGANSANPHATPTNRILKEGDLLVIDWGASYLGYISDITRTFAMIEVEPEYALIAETVNEANIAGRRIIRPGATASEVDQAARIVIEKAGYGQYFTHRTGHGIGMEGHEPPYIRGDNQLPLRQGMTFTVEPGIYLPGRGGVRIEDDVLVTDTGVESLTNLPRGLQVINH